PLGGLLERDIDDCGARLSTIQPIQQESIPLRGRDRRCPDMQIGPIESRHHGTVLRYSESRTNVFDDLGCGGCSQGENAFSLQFLRSFGQLQIIGPKVVAPFRNAMSFVDCKQSNPGASDALEESLIVESLR